MHCKFCPRPQEMGRSGHCFVMAGSRCHRQCHRWQPAARPSLSGSMVPVMVRRKQRRRRRGSVTRRLFFFFCFQGHKGRKTQAHPNANAVWMKTGERSRQVAHKRCVWPGRLLHGNPARMLQPTQQQHSTKTKSQQRRQTKQKRKNNQKE